MDCIFRPQWYKIDVVVRTWSSQMSNFLNASWKLQRLDMRGLSALASSFCCQKPCIDFGELSYAATTLDLHCLSAMLISRDRRDKYFLARTAQADDRSMCVSVPVSKCFPVLCSSCAVPKDITQAIRRCSDKPRISTTADAEAWFISSATIEKGRELAYQSWGSRLSKFLCSL